MVKSTFLTYIHYLRGLAILMIVGVHCLPSFSWDENLNSLSIFRSLLDNSTIIFVFIAGFLFQHLYHKHFSYKQYLSKKIKYVVLPYLIISVPAIADKILFGGDAVAWFPEYIKNSSNIIQIIYMIGTGKHFPPFWFIPMIVVFYLIAPVLLWLDRRKNFYTYLFPFILLAGFFSSYYGYYSDTISSFIYFLPVYILGMWTSRHKEMITGLGAQLAVPFLLVYLSIFLLEINNVITIDKLHHIDQLTETTFHFNFSKFKVILLCFILLNLFYLFKEKEMKILLLLGNYSFGIYFIHFYFIVIIQKLDGFLNLGLYLNAMNFIFYMIAVALSCIVIIAIVKKTIPTKSRLLIGS